MPSAVDKEVKQWEETRKCIDWRNERALWMLPSFVLSRELKRRHKASKGEKHELVSRVLMIDASKLDRNLQREANEKGDEQLKLDYEALISSHKQNSGGENRTADTRKRNVTLQSTPTVNEEVSFERRFRTNEHSCDSLSEPTTPRKRSSSHDASSRPKKRTKKTPKKYLKRRHDAKLAQAQAHNSADEHTTESIPPIFDFSNKTLLTQYEPYDQVLPSSTSIPTTSSCHHYFHTDAHQHINQTDGEAPIEKQEQDIIQDKALKNIIDSDDLSKIVLIQSNQPEDDESSLKESLQKKKRGRPRKIQQAPRKHYITSLAGLESCINLRKILISNHHIKNIDSLCVLKFIKEIWLSSNLIRTLPDSMGSLSDTCVALDLSFNSIGNITALSQMTKLRYLNLSYNKFIEDLSPLGSLTELEELDASGNHIKDLTCLEKFQSQQSLCTLRLNLNSIPDLDQIVVMQGLKELSLNSNQITILDPLLKMKRIREVDLQDNPGLIKSLQCMVNGKKDETGEKNVQVIQQLHLSHVRVIV
ncbi:hypothetical protein AKO1_009192 [Acrasis kona]|uniref:Uncharacterized protein n=1 Tax=Acrasis kona TaxID=1008807 RepID=A0AAW2ZJF3_9EUKA